MVAAGWEADETPASPSRECASSSSSVVHVEPATPIPGKQGKLVATEDRETLLPAH